jgi:hypothetical protein
MSDNFSDGNFTSNPSWTGDSADFIINAAGELQLNAAAAGESFLSVPANLSSADSLEWRFRVKMDFAPSSSNYTRFYITSDGLDPTQPLSGYFLQLGESLSNDAVELFRQSGTVITSVCRGMDGQIAAAFDLNIRLTRTPAGSWEIYTSPGSGGAESLIASGSDNGTFTGQWLSISCNYTSGNITRFHFDDIYAGPIVPDLDKPTITNFVVSSDSSLQITMSERLLNTSALQAANYSINGFASPTQIIVDSTNDYTITLLYNQHFISGNHYSLLIRDLYDRALNRMDDSLLQIEYFNVISGKANDVVFNEIYFELSTLSPLPNAEFVELYNRSDSAIQLANWTLSDGSSTAVFPDKVMPPKSYLVICDFDNVGLFSALPNVWAVPDFPGLNNDSGDSLTLKNASGELIGRAVFDDESYHDTHKKSGGWTIERIDADFPCEQKDNWKASESAAHGTPGGVNSVRGMFADELAPIVDALYLIDSLHLSIRFSEELVSTIISQNFTAIDANNGVNDCINVSQIGNNEHVLTFAQPFSASIYQLKFHSALSDCAGNLVDTTMIYRFGKPELAVAGDVVINELLFDPPDGCDDFVELFNCSPKIIDLSHWQISENDAADVSVVKDQALITDGHRLIFPGDYLVLNRDPVALRKTFNCPFREKMFQLSDLPDYNSDEGRVLLYDQNGSVIDQLIYSDDMHFALLNSPKGVSLERLNGYSGDRSNVQWHSAASIVGFATPTYRNSQWVEGQTSTGKVEVENEVFSPDNDGFDDLLAINYHFDDAGTILSLRIFTRDGVPIKDLLVNESLAKEGQIFWDGFSDAGRLALPGRYLIWAKTFNLSGKSEVFRTSCVVAVRR